MPVRMSGTMDRRVDKMSREYGNQVTHILQTCVSEMIMITVMDEKFFLMPPPRDYVSCGAHCLFKD